MKRIIVVVLMAVCATASFAGDKKYSWGKGVVSAQRPTPDAVIEALESDAFDIALRLIKSGVELRPDKKGREMLPAAMLRGNLSCVVALLRLGADPDAFGFGQQPPMILCGCRRHYLDRLQRPLYDMCTFLLMHSANPDRRGCSTCRTPLMWAARLGDLEMVRLLLERGADPTASTPDGETAETLALHYGHTHVLGPLLAAKMKRQR